ncbi:alpha/beta hydrolase [candidate division KSB1 bacterium]
MILKNILYAGIFIYLFLVILLYFFNARLIFFPDKNLYTTPADSGMQYEDAEIITKDGVRLHGWYVTNDSTDATIIYCHGNAGNISGRVDILKILHDLKINVLMFDYRGYGRSEGSPSEDGTYRDVEAAWRYITAEKGIPREKVILYGRSLGGPIAAFCASRFNPGGLILHGTFTSVPDVAETIYPKFLVKILPAFIKYPTGRYLNETVCPVLVIHSSEDTLIPFKFGTELYELAPNEKSFLETHGTHNDDIFMSEKIYKEGVKKFIDSIH